MAEANAAFSRLAGIRKENIVGKDCRLLEPLNRLWEGITSCIFLGTSQSDTLAFEGKHFEVTITPVVSADTASHVCIEFRDISSYVNLEREFFKRNRELIITSALSNTFISSENIGSVFDDLLDKVLLISDLGVGWVVTRSEERFVLQGLKGASLEFRNKLESGKLDFVYEEALVSGDPLYVIESDGKAGRDEFDKEGITFLVAIPLRAGGEVMGFVVLANRSDVRFDFDLASLLSIVGGNLSLIAEKISLFQEARHLAETDALTGLYNVRHFYEALEAEISRTERYSTTFSVLMFDIDDFKAINDAHGHQAGDEVLRLTGAIMKNAARKTDLIARYGGEEFMALLPNTNRDDALTLAARIKEAVESEQFLGSKGVRITLSGGIATYPYDARDASGLLNAADKAMYEAKAAGKKKIFHFSYGR